MDTLGQSLEAIRQQRAIAAVWAAVDAAHYVLSAFRVAVQMGALEVAPGEDPHYLFRPDAVGLPAEATFAVEDWVREEAYVLGVMRRVTGLDVSWEAGSPIVLKVPAPPKPTPVPEPALVPAASPVCAFTPAEPSCGWVAEGSCRKRLRTASLAGAPVGSFGAASGEKTPSTPSGLADTLKLLSDTLKLLSIRAAGEKQPRSWDSLQVSGAPAFSASAGGRTSADTGAAKPEPAQTKATEPVKRMSMFDRMFGEF